MIVRRRLDAELYVQQLASHLELGENLTLHIACVCPGKAAFSRKLAFVDSVVVGVVDGVVGVVGALPGAFLLPEVARVGVAAAVGVSEPPLGAPNGGAANAPAGDGGPVSRGGGANASGVGGVAAIGACSTGCSVVGGGSISLLYPTHSLPAFSFSLLHGVSNRTNKEGCHRNV